MNWHKSGTGVLLERLLIQSCYEAYTYYPVYCDKKYRYQHYKSSQSQAPSGGYATDSWAHIVIIAWKTCFLVLSTPKPKEYDRTLKPPEKQQLNGGLLQSKGNKVPPLE